MNLLMARGFSACLDLTQPMQQRWNQLRTLFSNNVNECASYQSPVGHLTRWGRPSWKMIPIHCVCDWTNCNYGWSKWETYENDSAWTGTAQPSGWTGKHSPLSSVGSGQICSLTFSHSNRQNLSDLYNSSFLDFLSIHKRCNWCNRLFWYII